MKPTMAMLSSLMVMSFFFALFLCHGFVKLGALSPNSYKQFQSLQSSTISDTDQPYRTGYHFQPLKNWMNDPNGPMIYKGVYHLFYQYNPYSPISGNKTWAHSTSTDLINWTPRGIPIDRTEPYDIKGVWSGSATILPNGEPAILYTGKNIESQQSQNLAMPKNPQDPYLTEWVKSPRNPLMVATQQNLINATSFRDPTTAWLGPDGHWRVIVGSKVDTTGLAILYRSKDFVNWVQAKVPLHSASGTGMWECPDFFPVNFNGEDGIDTSSVGPNVKHVLKVSLDDTKHDCYTVGTYDVTNDVYTPDQGFVDGDSGLRYDYGKFYASKSFFDGSKNRRILWGWVNESSSSDADVKKGWSGVQAIPRTIWLDKSGKQLVQWPIKEIEMLRTNPIHLHNKFLNQGSFHEISGVTAAQADVEITFDVSEHASKAEVLDPSLTNPQFLCSEKGLEKGSLGPFGLLVLASKDMEEFTAVFFRIFRDEQNKYSVLMCSDQSRSSLDQDNDLTSYGTFVDVDIVDRKLSLRTLVDHSIVESFSGGGKSCITARVYPMLAINEAAKLYVFNNGTQSVKIRTLSSWSMKTAKIN